jgi:hypothetical protein
MLSSRITADDEEAVQAELAALEAEQVRKISCPYSSAVSDSVTTARRTASFCSSDATSSVHAYARYVSRSLFLYTSTVLTYHGRNGQSGRRGAAREGFQSSRTRARANCCMNGCYSTNRVGLLVIENRSSSIFFHHEHTQNRTISTRL